MFQVTKRIEFSASHFLKLHYPSPCSKLHGHNYIVEIEIMGGNLDEEGMLIDFSLIKNVVNKLDHKHLNDIFVDKNPTAENIADWIAVEVTKTMNELKINALVASVSVQENEGNTATWKR